MRAHQWHKHSVKMQKLNSNRFSSGSAFPSRKYSAGFSLFELVVFIIAVAIIYASAVNRFSRFPEAAERANFLAVAAQIQTGVSLEIMLGVAAGSSQNMSRYDGANPIDMLLSPPSNYLGAIGNSDRSNLPLRSWYFDLRSSELVYLVNESPNVYLLVDGVQVPTSEIRFSIVANYRYVHKQTGVEIANIDDANAEGYQAEDYRRRFSGVLLQVVTPYQWLGSGITLQEGMNPDEPS